MRISLGQRAHDAHPVTTECSWPQFVEWLYSHQRTAGDKDGPYICLAEFTPHAAGHVHPKNGPACTSTAPYRSLSTLVASCGVPLDFDNGRVSEELIRATLNGYAYVAYTTYKHTDAAQRWRVFVPVVAPMDAATHKATWATLNAAFSDMADKAASDASRLSYLPNACIEPAAARMFHADGALLQPTQAAPSAPVVTERGDGPVPGWAGPADDATLLTIASNTRQKPSERFGGPIHFAMLWAGNTDWLAQNFPPSSDDYGKGRTWNYTQADAALANELMYFTGGDTERAAALMRRSGIARDHDDDWSNRKVYAALALAMNGRGEDQFHFMGSAKDIAAIKNPAQPTDSELRDACADISVSVSVGGVPVPAGTPSAQEAVLANAPPGSSMNDFYAFLPDHTYIHRPSGVACSSASVDEVIGKEARQVLAPMVPIHSYTWAPGYPERFTLDTMDPTHVGGEQVWLYNQYRAPRAPAAGGDVSLWLNLVNKLFPDDADHIVNYFADAVQNPGRKCNHALVLGSGVHGTGKDTLLVGLQHAVGNKNFRAIKPHQVAEQFTPWMRSVVVQVSESRDMGEGFVNISRFELYERCKDLAAAPPLALDCNEKHKGQYPVANVLRLILTTNHQVDGLYMDPQDRRHFCAWSDAPKMTEAEANAMYAWYENGGLDAVAHFLRHKDLSGFNAKAAPPRTGWWHQLVAGGASQEEEKFADALDKLGRPEWTTLTAVSDAGGPDLTNWTKDPRNRRKVEREMVKSGYQRLPNDGDKRGRWSFNCQQVVVYRRSDVAAKTLLAKFNP